MIDEKIQMTVAIVIDPRAARAVAHSRMQKAGLFRDIRKRAVAIVVKQNILAPAGNKEVVEPVVVVVAYGNAGRPNAAAQSGLRGYVFERAVAIVVIKPD